MAPRDPLAPRLGATLAVVGIAVIAVLVAGALTTSGPNGDAVLETSATTTPTTAPATVLGATVDRLPASPAAPVASVPPAVTSTAPPTTTTTAPPPPEPPTTTTTVPPPPTAPPTTPAPTTVAIALSATGSGDVSVTVTGPSGSQVHALGPGGGSRLVEGLPPGTYQLFARVEGEPSGPDGDGTQVGGGTLVVPSSPIGLAPGDRLSATFDGSDWTLVLS